MENTNFNAGLAYSEFKGIKAAYIVAALTAFFMSAYFVVGYFAGHLNFFTWNLAQWMQAFPSIGLVGFIPTKVPKVPQGTLH